jgi:nucleoside-diphosphate-sugar epimerase
VRDTVLVTGASGFIGHRLTQRLLEAGATVHGVPGRHAAEPALGPVWHRVDLEDRAATRALLAQVRPQVIYHLAGFVSGVRELDAVVPSLVSNLLTTVNVLEAVTELRGGRVILAGSLEEPEPDGTWPVPSSPYAAAKFAASTYARMFHALYGTPVVILRPFMVYGPAQHRLKLVPYVARALLRGEAPRLSSGQRAVDWVFLDDVIEAFLAAATAADVEGHDYDVGSGLLVTVRQVVEELVRIIEPVVEPVFGGVPDRPLEQIRCARIADTARSLGWSPKTSLAEGLRRTVDWHREELRRQQAAALS